MPTKQLHRFHMTYLDEQGKLQRSDITTTDPQFRRRLDAPTAHARIEKQFEEMDLQFLSLESYETITIDTMTGSELHAQRSEDRRGFERRAGTPLLRLVPTPVC